MRERETVHDSEIICAQCICLKFFNLSVRNTPSTIIEVILSKSREKNQQQFMQLITVS